MKRPTESAQKAGLSDYLAAERTFLAWIRTGLALMGFGFVVARFGLFLKQIEALRAMEPHEGTGLSLWFGTALIAAGVILNILAGSRHLKLVRQLDGEETPRSDHTRWAAALAFFLAAVGLAMAIYFISIRA